MDGHLEPEGRVIAQAALAEFDQAVAEFAEALADKPDEAEALERLEAIYAAHLPTMQALGERRRGLTDPQEKYGFFSHINEHRPKAVHRKDEVLGPVALHYNLVKPAPEVLEFLKKRVPGLLDVAHVE